jgi:hypothetical protein
MVALKIHIIKLLDAHLAFASLHLYSKFVEVTLGGVIEPRFVALPELTLGLNRKLFVRFESGHVKHIQSFPLLITSYPIFSEKGQQLFSKTKPSLFADFSRKAVSDFVLKQS